MLDFALHLSKPDVEKMKTAVQLLEDLTPYAITTTLENNLINEKIRTIRQKIDLVKLQEELYKSIKLDDALAVRRLMTQGVKLEDALWLAVGHGPREVITDVFTLSSRKKTSLFGHAMLVEAVVRSALESGNFDTFQLLLKLGSGDKFLVHNFTDILERSLDQRKPEVSEYIVKANLVEAKCALELFAKHGKCDLVDWLLRNFESSISSKSLTAALEAACRGTWNAISLSTVEKLLEKGASAGKENNAWNVGLAQAASKNKLWETKFFLLKGAIINSGTVETVVRIGAIGVFSLFLEYEFQLPNETQPGVYGNILQTAAFQGCHQMVVEIISKGYDIDSRLGNHGTSLMLALQAGHQDIASFLISKGADANFGIPAIGNALYFAALCGMERITKELVEKKADVNATGGEFGSALQAAVVRGHVIVVLFLLDSGADVNIQGGKHGNALRAALAQGNRKVAELLLLSGARVGEEPKPEEVKVVPLNMARIMNY